MRYYIISPDKNMTDIPRIREFHQVYPANKLNLLHSRKLPRSSLLLIEPNIHTIFPDVLIAPVPMFSEDAWQVLKAYEPRIISKELLLLDQENELLTTYYLPILSQIDCMQKDTLPAQNTTIYRDKLGRQSIFQSAGRQYTKTIIRMDLAESLLYRNMRGFSLTETKLI